MSGSVSRWLPVPSRVLVVCEAYGRGGRVQRERASRYPGHRPGTGTYFVVEAGGKIFALRVGAHVAAWRPAAAGRLRADTERGFYS
jgi:hypothetical protein